MARKGRTIFADSDDGRLFVRVEAVMNPMIPFVDGLPLTFFGKSTKAYLDIDTAIKWCREEFAHSRNDKYRIMYEVMERAKAQPQAERVYSD
jgi:hypothetical protein